MAGNSKNALTPFHLLVAQSLGASFSSVPVNIQYLDNTTVQLIFTGSPVGTFSIEGSVNHAANAITGVETVAGTWTPITSSAVSAAGDILFDLNQLSFPWIRVSYTRTSGTGSVEGYISAKAV